MAITTDQSRFVFRGNAMPFGGRIVNIGGTPVSKPIEGPPSSALTVAGGRSYATGKPSSFNNIFKWGDTVAESVGLIRPADRHAVTTVTSDGQVLCRNQRAHYFRGGRPQGCHRF